MELCKEGLRLAREHRDVCIRASGECTPLYYHIQECDKCEELNSIEALCDEQSRYYAELVSEEY